MPCSFYDSLRDEIRAPVSFTCLICVLLVMFCCVDSGARGRRDHRGAEPLHAQAADVAQGRQLHRHVDIMEGGVVYACMRGERGAGAWFDAFVDGVR